MIRHYDQDGNPMDFLDWILSFEDTDARRVAHDVIGMPQEGDEVTVSTVWLGLDHNFGGGPPLIFETMVFGGPHDQYQRRYSTKAEALAGHTQIADAVAAGNDPDIQVAKTEE